MKYTTEDNGSSKSIFSCVERYDLNNLTLLIIYGLFCWW